MGAVLACSFRRLHIAPFTAELEDKIIAPSIKPLAKDISFHSKPTFPEKGFGFVELPEMEAEKLKKKFNGSTLKGQKVKIEDAKPDRKRKSDDEDEGGGKRKALRRDKRAREEGVLPGVEIEEGRVVKRGWGEDGTRAKGKRKPSTSQPADAVVEGKRLRFKTTVPPNAAPVEDPKDKKKKGKADKKVVVEEFGKSQKALVTSGNDPDAEHGALSYEDGKGWVDEDGNVVEAERQSKRPSRRKAAKAPEPAIGAIESTETNEPVQNEDMVIDAEVGESSKPQEDVSEPPKDDAESSKEVHPLEAIFKRPTSSSSNSAKSRPKPIDTSFSFFDAGAADEDADMTGAVPPKTPNTKRDLEWRSIRSAAPTPDTAAIGRKFSFPFASGNLDEDDSSEDDAEMDDTNQTEPGASKSAQQEQGEESAFRKWFYEHRGEFNRGWKKRRREEKKQKRQRENRRLSRRVA